jgi:hypothetical protein
METEAFLSEERQSSDEDSPVVLTPRIKHVYRFYSCIFALEFGNQFLRGLLELPLVRLLELSICRNAGIVATGSSEEACKVPSVQDKLALVIGLKSAFDALPCNG